MRLMSWPICSVRIGSRSAVGSSRGSARSIARRARSDALPHAARQLGGSFSLPASSTCSRTRRWSVHPALECWSCSRSRRPTFSATGIEASSAAFWNTIAMRNGLLGRRREVARQFDPAHHDASGIGRLEPDECDGAGQICPCRSGRRSRPARPVRRSGRDAPEHGLLTVTLAEACQLDADPFFASFAGAAITRSRTSSGRSGSRRSG